MIWGEKEQPALGLPCFLLRTGAGALEGNCPTVGGLECFQCVLPIQGNHNFTLWLFLEQSPLVISKWDL